MSSPVISVRQETPVQALIQLLLEHRISGVPVVDNTGILIGIVSEGDLILRERATRPRTSKAYLFQQLFADHAKLAREYRKSHGLTASDVMTREVVTCNPGTPVAEVANLMAEKHVKRIPVVEDDLPVGIIVRSDILKLVAERMRDEPAAATDPLDDRAIARVLVEHLRNEPWAKVERLQVTAEDGVVVLRGLVENEQEHAAIELAAQRTPGVIGVHNELAIVQHYRLDDEV